MKRYRQFVKEQGQALTEYVVILTIVAVVVLVFLEVKGPLIGNTFSVICGGLSGRPDPPGCPGPGMEGAYHNLEIPSTELSPADLKLLGEAIDRARDVTVRQEHAITEKIPRTVEHEAKKTVQIILKDAVEPDFRAALEELLRQVEAGNLEAMLAFFDSESEWWEDLANVSDKAKANVERRSLKAREKVCREALNHGMVPFDPYFSDIIEILDRDPENTADARAILLEAWDEIIVPRNNAASTMIDALQCNADSAQ